MPASDDVHEFHGLALFAMGDYQKAAAIAHTTLDAGPGWELERRADPLSVTGHLYAATPRVVEHYISEHPNQAATRSSCWATST